MTRTISTAAELDALPFPNVVTSPGHGDWHKRRDGRWMRDDGDVLTSGALAIVANGGLTLTGDPSATREDVVKVLMDHAHDEGINACECGDWSEWDEEDWDARAAAWSAHVHDALLARFTIAPRTGVAIAARIDTACEGELR